jgi:hypothetical protein
MRKIRFCLPKLGKSLKFGNNIFCKSLNAAIDKAIFEIVPYARAHACTPARTRTHLETIFIVLEIDM